MGSTTLQNYLLISSKTKLDPAILLPGIYPSDFSVYIHHRVYERWLFAALVIIAPNWKQYKYPTIYNLLLQKQLAKANYSIFIKWDTIQQ